MKLKFEFSLVISDFGGLLGLFMGCSLLSITEIFHFTITGFFASWQKTKTGVKNVQSWTQKSASVNLNDSLIFQRNIMTNEIMKVIKKSEAKIEKALQEIRAENEIKTKRILKEIENLGQELLNSKKNFVE